MNIAILGGGVAGISAAIALKLKGFDVSVYERHADVSDIGAGIVIWPNAAFVLEQLGVLAEIAAVSGKPEKMRRLSSLNEDLGALDIELINAQMGYNSFSILRRDFQRVLLARLADLGVTVQYDHTVTRIDSSTLAEALVYFSNGRRISADIVVGAEGRMASYARQFVHGNNTPVYQGFINWVGVFESEQAVFQDMEVGDYWGLGERFGIVPIDSHKAYWAGGVASAAIGRREPAEYKAELLSIFADWPPLVQKMVAHTPVEQINKIYVHDHDPIKTWHKHNLIVIGDAAHAPLPTSGQGACQALEDAWHLANCLLVYPQDLQQAFAAFTGLRFDKTAGIIMAGRSLAGSLFNRDEQFCLARNEISRNTDFSKMATAISRGWSQHLPLNS